MKFCGQCGEALRPADELCGVRVGESSRFQVGAQLSTSRRARHAAVADAIATTEAERLDEHAGLLAHHWSEAGEALRAATWHVRAARWVRNTDLLASRRNWAQARTLLVALPESAERTRLLLDVYPELINMLDRLGADPVESESVFREALDLARTVGERRTEALLEADYSQIRGSQNDFDSMVEHAARAITLADAEGDRAIGLLARHFLGRGYAWQAHWKESIAVFDQSIAIGGGDDAAEIEVLGWRPHVESLGIRAACLSITGRLREARAAPGARAAAGGGVGRPHHRLGRRRLLPDDAGDVRCVSHAGGRGFGRR
jgi:hypothetical protein